MLISRAIFEYQFSVKQQLKTDKIIIFALKTASILETNYFQGKVVSDMEHENLFWAQQVINNACGTQALISILLNIEGNKIKLGEELENFQNFTIGIDGESKGFALSNAEGIRKVHNSFSKQQLFELEEPKNQVKFIQILIETFFCFRKKNCLTISSHSFQSTVVFGKSTVSKKVRSITAKSAARTGSTLLDQFCKREWRNIKRAKSISI